MSDRPCPLSEEVLLGRFEAGTVSASEFDHASHVRVAFAYLRRMPLPETMIRMRDGLTRIATAHGHPDRYHETITFAFAALINERLADRDMDWAGFCDAYPNLLRWGSGSLLDDYYPSDLLRDPAARRQFLLPRRSPQR